MQLTRILAAIILLTVLSSATHTRPVPPLNKSVDLLIGEKWINFTTDHDVIFNTQAVAGFNKIILRVIPGQLKMNNLKIHYLSGKVQDVVYTQMLHTGILVASIPLTDGAIHKIEFGYLKRYITKNLTYHKYGRIKTKLAIWGII